MSWWTDLTPTAKRIAIIAGAIGAVAGAITATNAAWPLVYPYTPALQLHINDVKMQNDQLLNSAIKRYDESVIQPLRESNREAILWSYEERRIRTDIELKNMKVLFEQTQNEQLKLVLQRQIEDIMRNQQNLDDRIKFIKSH